ncbi:glutathionyl-hydroquinone reductase YqjG-like [Dysidea avara]|uniref:glutathionyl-hydroquinone reductase YqjG-like n=1 Tax=Dysidea avara TaxID=196820 RepID=UPI00332132C5
MAETGKDLKTNEKPKESDFRPPSAFRKFVSRSSDAEYPAERNRYHLYVSYACPWAHRTLIYRKLKGLQDVISVDVVYWKLSEVGWMFSPDMPDCTPDTVNGKTCMKDLYLMADSNFEGRYTVPVLWDKKKKTIVNNESAEIIRMLNTEFNEFSTKPDLDLYPEKLRNEIDELNEWIYKGINNGVYGVAFSIFQGSQEKYDKTVQEVFAALDRVEGILSQRRYLTGNTITEADVRLYVTLVRFDAVYVGHFKCNIRRIIDYPNLWGYLRDLYQTPGFGDTTNIVHVKGHYQQSHLHLQINPQGIVAAGPDIDFTSPHGRADKFK